MRIALAWVATAAALLATTAGATTSPTPLAQRCYQKVQATAFHLTTSDGVVLYAAVLGTGRVGVVLAGQRGDTACGWLAEAKLMSSRGYRVLVFDYRNTGDSGRVGGKAAGRIDNDVVAAAAELRRRGAKRLVLIGASIGGDAVLTASLATRVACIVSISAPDSSLLRGEEFEVLDPTSAAAHVHTPILFLAARGDPFVAPSSTAKLAKAATAKDKRLVVVAGIEHGVAIVEDPSTKALRTILGFVRAHARG